MIPNTYQQISKAKEIIENIIVNSESILTEKNVDELEEIRDSLDCFEIGE